MWLIMRGALSASSARAAPGLLPAVDDRHRDGDPRERTTMSADERAAERQRERIAAQTAGVEALPGTYPFTLERSVKAYRINKFLHELIASGEARPLPGRRRKTRSQDAGLTEEERDLVRRRDWQGLIHYGVIFFMLEKLGAVIGVSNLHIYAAMRGETLEDFQKTRNAPGALYSVAGKDAGALAWDRTQEQMPKQTH